MPGGKLEFGESFEQGAIREVFEETGIDVSSELLEVISLTNDMVPDAHFVTIGLICRGFNGEPQVTEPDEITQWKWFALDNLPSPLFEPSKKIILNYTDKKIYRN